MKTIVLISILMSGALLLRAADLATNGVAVPPPKTPPTTLVLTNQVIDQTARRIALARQVNEEWTVERLKVAQEVSFQQRNPVLFGDRGGRMNIHCSLHRNETVPQFFLLSFVRYSEDERWQKYRPVIVNCKGKIRTLEDDGFDTRYKGGVLLEQMTFIVPVSDFRDWARQTEIGFSVAGEEFTLTEHTLNKWRTLLAYFDLNESQRAQSK